MEKSRNKGLDIIRGLAAASVFLTHLKLIFSSGYLEGFSGFIFKAHDYFLRLCFYGKDRAGNHPGVIIFIVLSGFCIHLATTKKPQILENRSFLKNYFLRRVCRIFPLYISGCLLGQILIIILNKDSISTPQLFRDQDNQNFYLFILKILFLGPLVPNYDTKLGNPPLETVAAEMWLYACYPILLFILKRKGPFATLLPGILAYILSVFLLWFGVDNMAMLMHPLRYLLLWTFGMLASEFASKCRKQNILNLCAFPFFYFIYLLFIYSVSFKGSYLIQVPLLGLVVAYALFILSTNYALTAIFNSKILNPFVKLGEVSYSLYVVHWPVILIMSLIAELESFSQSFLTLSAVLILYSLTKLAYNLIEYPSHLKAKSFLR